MPFNDRTILMTSPIFGSHCIFGFAKRRHTPTAYSPRVDLIKVECFAFLWNRLQNAKSVLLWGFNQGWPYFWVVGITSVPKIWRAQKCVQKNSAGKTLPWKWASSNWSMRAWIPITLGFWMVTSCSDAEWFGFWMAFQTQTAWPFQIQPNSRYLGYITWSQVYGYSV